MVTENSSVATEFAGDYKVVIIDVDGTSGVMTLAVDEMTLVKSAVCQLKVAPVVACALVVGIPATDGNTVTMNAYKSDLVNTATQSVADFFLTCIGY